MRFLLHCEQCRQQKFGKHSDPRSVRRRSTITDRSNSWMRDVHAKLIRTAPTAAGCCSSARTQNFVARQLQSWLSLIYCLMPMNKSCMPPGQSSLSAWTRGLKGLGCTLGMSRPIPPSRLHICSLPHAGRCLSTVVRHVPPRICGPPRSNEHVTCHM